MTRLEKQILLRDSLCYTPNPTTLTEFHDYLVYHVMTYCIENGRSLSSIARSCKLGVGYFDEVYRVRNMTIDTAFIILEYVGVFDKDTDIYGIISETYDEFVFRKFGITDADFSKSAIRNAITQGTTIRVDTLLTFIRWLNTDFDTFFRYFGK